MFKRTNTNTNVELPKNSITVKDHISLSVFRKQEFTFKYLSLILTAFLGCFGSIYSFISIFNFRFYEAGLFFYLIIFFMLFVIMFLLPKKFLFALIPTSLVYIALIKKYWDAYINGFQSVFNKIYNTINYSNIEYYKVSPRISISDCTTTFLVFSSFILVMFICYFVIVKPNFLICFLFTFPLLELGLYNGFAPKYMFGFMLISFWIAMIVMQNSSYTEYASKTNANFLRKNNNFYSKPNIKFRVDGLSTIWAITFSLSILILTNVVINIISYQRPQSINNIRSNVKTAVEEFSIDDIQGSIGRIKSSITKDPASNPNSVKLGQYSSLKHKNTTDLVVNVSYNPHETIYLKNYVGSVYTGSSWDVIPREKYNEYSSVFDKIELYKYYPQDFLLYNNIEFTNPFYTNSIKITPSYKYHNANFVPYYSLNKDDEFIYIDDTTIALDNKQEYDFKIKNIKGPYGTVDNFEDYYKINSFNKYSIESSYSDFVYDNYMSLPKGNNMDELYQHYSYIFESNNPPYIVLSEIQDALARDAKYSLSPGKTPRNRDFVNYFLLENNEGYCTHFASAGAILARMAGIPTRYVTGYIVPKSEFNPANKTQDSSYKINVKDKYAHAWVEVYLDGIGWLPYEFTPGYSDGDAPEEETKETKKAKETSATKKTVEKTTPAAKDSRPTASESKQTSTSKADDAGVAPKKNAFENSIGYTIMLVLLIIMLTVIFIIFKRKIMLSRTYKGFKSDNNNLNIINLYSYITQILAFTGIENNNMQYLDFANYVESNSIFFKKDEMKTIVNYVLKAGLSEHISSQEEVDFMLSAARKIVYDVYNQQSLSKKLQMKYGFNFL